MVGTARHRGTRVRRRGAGPRSASGSAIGIDARDGRVAVRGWVDVSDVDALDLARSMAERGVQDDRLHRHRAATAC